MGLDVFGRERLTESRRARKNTRPFAKLKWEEHKTCCYCGREITEAEMAGDHLIPLSRGGSNNRSNIEAACIGCDMGKKNKTAEEYVLGRTIRLLRILRTGVHFERPLTREAVEKQVKESKQKFCGRVVVQVIVGILTKEGLMAP